MGNLLESGLDGQIFIDGNKPPAPNSRLTENPDLLWEERIPYSIDTGKSFDFDDELKTETTLYERVLFLTKDPTTLPKSRTKCVKYARTRTPWGDIKTCVGWKTQLKWFFVKGELKVTTSVPLKIGEAVEDCLKEGAIIALVAALVTAGSGAVAAAEAGFKACLLRKFGENLLTVSINLSHTWGNWEG